MYKNGKLIRSISKAAYTMGVVFLIAGMLMSFVTQPVMAQEGTPPAEPPPAEEQPPVQITDVTTDVVPEGPAAPEVVQEPTEVVPPVEPTCLDSEKVQKCADGSEAAEVTAEDGTVSVLCADGAAPELVCPNAEPPAAPPQEEPPVEETTEPVVVPTEEPAIEDTTAPSPENTTTECSVELVSTCADGSPAAEDGTCADLSTPTLVCPAAPAADVPADTTCPDGAAQVLTCADGALPLEDGTCADLSTPTLVCPAAPAADVPTPDTSAPTVSTDAVVLADVPASDKGGIGECVNSGSSEKLSVNASFPFSQSGYVIDYVIVKSGSPNSQEGGQYCFPLERSTVDPYETTNGCYTATWNADGTSVLSVEKTGADGPSCKDISHVQVYGHKPPPEPEDLTVSGRCDVTSPTVTWVVNNPNNFAVDYSYSTDGGLNWNDTTAAPGNNTLPYTGTGQVMIRWDKGNSTDQASVESCAPDISGEAVINCDGATLTVTNSGNAAGTYSWELIQDGTTTVDSGTDVPIGAGSVQNINSSVDPLHQYQFSLNGELVGAPVTLGPCAPILDWDFAADCSSSSLSVTNTGDQSVEIHWAVVGPNAANSDSGSETIQPNGIPVVLFTGPGGSGKYNFFGGTSSEPTELGDPITVGACTLTPGISADCHNIQVSITSDGSATVDYKIYKNAEVTPIVEQTGVLLTTGPNTFNHAVDSQFGDTYKVVITDGQSQYEASATVEQICSLTPPRISWECRTLSAGFDQLWTINNPNDVEVCFTPTNGAGCTTIPAKSSTTITMPNGANSLGGCFTLAVGDNRETTNGVQACTEVVTSVLCTADQRVLGHDEPKCNAAGNGIVWSFHNTNAFAGTIIWSLDGGAQTGSLPIAAGAQVKFETAPLGSHMVIVYLQTAFGNSPTLNVPANITSCGKKEEKKPPEELYVPVGKPQALIPVTGLDLGSLLGSRFLMIQQLLINFGLVFLGIAMVLDGYTRKFKQE